MTTKKEPKSRKASGKSRRAKGKPRAALVNLLPDGDELYAVFQLSMDIPTGASPAALEVSVQVETDTGATRSWDDLGYHPVIESWRFLPENTSPRDLRPSRHAAGTGDTDIITLSPGHDQAVIFVRQQRGLAVSLKISQVQTDIEED